MEGREDLRLVLKRRGLSAADVASIAKISTSTLYRVFNGAASPSTTKCVEYVLRDPVVARVEQQ